MSVCETGAAGAAESTRRLGVGEAGAIPGGALFAQAIEDVLDFPARGVELNSIPLSPSQLWELIDPFPVRDLNAMR